MESILKKIASTAQIYLSGSPYIPVSVSRSPTIETSRSFPDPPSLLHLLLAAGARNDVATRINDVYFSRVMEFKSHCENAVADACSRIAQTSVNQSNNSAPALQEKIISAFTDLYSKAIQSWTVKALTMLKEHGTDGVDARQGNLKTGRRFNHEYLPLLEHFFDENPFPTHADKAFLAKKSGMTYRQIHVWFQNRRSRSKKEGKLLRRKPMSDGAMLPLDNLLSRMEKYTKKRHSPARTANSIQAIQPCTVSQFRDTPKTDGDIFEKPAPQHAYPMCYPPSCSYEPFPKDYTNLRSHQSHWPRQRPCSNSSRRTSIAPISLADLTEKFSQMNVRSDDSTCLSSKSFGSGAATFAITVPYSSAPHPALIRMPVHPRTPTKQFSAIPAIRSQLEHVFLQPNSRSPSFCLQPVESATQDCSRRKIAPLPRRATESPSTYRALSISPSRTFATELSFSDDSVTLPELSSSSSSSGYSPRISTPTRSSAVQMSRLECTAELFRDLSAWYSPTNVSTTDLGIRKVSAADYVCPTVS